jgi:hypothetical protein
LSRSRTDCRQQVCFSNSLNNKATEKLEIQTSAALLSILKSLLREEYRLRVFEKRVLRRIFGPKGDEVTGGWRGLHNEELRNMDISPSVIRMIKSRSMRCGRRDMRVGY